MTEGISLDELQQQRAERQKEFHGGSGDVKVMKEAEGPNLHIVTTSNEIRTLEQLLAYCKVDLGLWKVAKHIINSWGGGENENFQVKAWLERKEQTFDFPSIMTELKSQAQQWSPSYPEINNRPRMSTGNMLELSLFDHHFGQLVWGKETRGGDYDVNIAKDLAIAAVENILNRVEYISVERIVLPIGNDFFNVNSQNNTTFAGTPQAEDGRWQKTFIAGVNLWIEIIDRCRRIAPVDVVIVVGNHDTERTFYLGTALECWYHNSSDVLVDNTPPIRKYYQWGECMIMYTHRDENQKGWLAHIMATEQPVLWSRTKYREIHKGHTHAANMKTIQVMEEELGVREWVLPSLVSIDDWHAKKGYTALRETMANLWNDNKGKTDIFMFHPE
jgi:hypothetical protein